MSPLAAADGPLAGAGRGVELGCEAVLLGLGRCGGVAAAAPGGPGLAGGLVLAAERAAAADGLRVATGLACGDRLQGAGHGRSRLELMLLADQANVEAPQTTVAPAAQRAMGRGSAAEAPDRLGEPGIPAQ